MAKSPDALVVSREGCVMRSAAPLSTVDRAAIRALAGWRVGIGIEAVISADLGPDPLPPKGKERELGLKLAKIGPGVALDLYEGSFARTLASAIL